MAFDQRWRFTVRSYEAGADQTVRGATLLNYLEEGATQASGAYGFTLDWYMSRNQFWVVRRLQLRIEDPVRRADELELHTWISDIRRVASNREYDLRRVSDGRRVLRARHDWVYINAQTLRPERVPPEFTGMFTPDETQEPIDLAIPERQAHADAPHHTTLRRADYSEIDLAGIVNNAVYVGWCESAWREATYAAGLAQALPGDVQMRIIGHEVDYLRSARERDPIRIDTVLSGIGRERAEWTNEVTHAETGEVLGRDRLLVGFAQGDAVCAVPAEFHDALFAVKG